LAELVSMILHSERLPIDDVLAQIAAGLEGNPSLILVAEPGAGKTTRVPLALLDAPWLQGRKIVMLEPRRVAARAAARRMAESLGEEPGGVVG
jgi:ATP-dependent helicase HrpB